MDELNQKMTAGGITPRKTKFETQKDYLRKAIDEAAASARSLKEFQKQLFRQLSYFTQDQPWAVQLSPSGAWEIYYGKKPGDTVGKRISAVCMGEKSQTPTEPAA